MSPKFEAAVAIVLDIEKGISRHPADRGGLTKYGISQRQYPTVDIANLTLAQAKGILHRDYWTLCRCDDLPWAFALAVFDAAVLDGPGTAGQLLQKALRLKPTQIDGIIGSRTVAFAKAVAGAKVPDVLADMHALRVLDNLKDPTFATFGRGWCKRLFDIHAKCLKGS